MFTLPSLNYAKDALEPFMSARTIEFHHGKHHQTYIDNLNKLIAGTRFENMTLEDIIIQTAQKTEYTSIFNNAAQTYNHNFFFKCLSPNGGKKPDTKLLNRIEKTFGSYENFEKEFKTAALNQFGSGWAWLVEDAAGTLSITKTSNADTPIAHKLKPLITIDVWEHAYYLDYQNRRADFIDSFLAHLVKWQ